MENEKKRISLHTMLIGSYVVLVVLLALIWGMLSYISGKSIALSGVKYSLEATAQKINRIIDQQVIATEDILLGPPTKGLITPQIYVYNRQKLISQFQEIASTSRSANYNVYYATSTGLFWAISRESINSFLIFLKLAPERKRQVFLYKKDRNQLIFQYEEGRYYNPCMRPWYKLAMDKDTSIWTPVYIDFGTNNLIITRARQITDNKGKTEGVIATDITLQAIEEYVRSVNISKHGIAFIVEPDGNLIASSATPTITKLPDGKYSRLNITNTENTLLKEVYKRVKKEIEKAGDSNTNTVFSFSSSSGEVIHVDYSFLNASKGLNWISVVALPEKDFMTQVKENVRQSAILAILATLAAIIIGIFILRRITADIKTLTKAFTESNKGILDHLIKSGKTDELVNLAKNFATMQDHLETDLLTQLANRYALKKVLEKSTSTPDKSPFSLIFIDINKFKKINDTYGHETGDLVLVEVARRMQARIRQEDFLARLAGDEFIALIPGLHKKEDLDTIKTKLCEALTTPVQKEGKIIQLYGASMGISHYPEDGVTAEELIKVADQRMYNDKQKQKFFDKYSK